MQSIKKYQKMKNIPWWKIADVIGISESCLYVWLRHYDPVHYEKILSAIREIEGSEKE